MAEQQETEAQGEQETEAQGEQETDAHAKAEEAKERYEKAEQKIEDLEDDPPTNLEDWPDDEAKYITLGGTEGGQSYDEGPTKNLGPHDLERHEDGSISIEGEKVDDPDEYKADPIPGGPTDPNAPKLAGEEKKAAKQERDEGDDSKEE
jgi:hypothetical protein